VNVSGEDTTGRGASGGRGAEGDEAAWRDLIARFDMPVGPQDAVPWPDRESLAPPAAGPRTAGPGTAGPGTAGPGTAGPGTAGPETADPEAAAPETADPEAAAPGTVSPGTADPLRSADRARVIRPAAPHPNGIPVPLPPADAADGAPADAAGAGLAGAGALEADDADADLADGEHFVPPPPPPLPHLDSVAKGAWTALFGGPAYLLVATLLGWVIPGWAALLAVVAFVGGFAVVALRLGDRPPDDAGPDDGAVL
jgi:hypothetical protein